MTTTTRTHSQARPIPESWIEAIDGFDYWLAAADKSPRTRELQRVGLDATMSRWLRPALG